MQVLYIDKNVIIFEAVEVFEACIQGGFEEVKDLMYMHSTDAYTHFFKCPVSRNYKTVNLKKP